MSSRTAVVAIRETLCGPMDTEDLIPGDPLPGAHELLERLAADGYDVIISDPLLNTPRGFGAAIRWFAEHQLPYTDFSSGVNHPRADLYVNGLSCTPLTYTSPKA